MHKLDKKRKQRLGEPSGIGLFAKKPRTSSELKGLEMSVVSGDSHIFLYIKDKDGEDKLYACGGNYCGQLGLGHTNNISRWTKVPFPKDFILEKVVVGYRHSILKGKGKDGEDKLYACGDNEYGQLGLGDGKTRSKWTEVPVPQGFSVEKVIPGLYHSFLKGKGKDGEDKLYATGYNMYGQLGLGDNEHRNQWIEVPVPQGFSVQKVIAGGFHTFLKGKGANGKDKLYACGWNIFGQLGVGNFNDRKKFTEVRVPQGFSVEKVIAGGEHSILKGKGKDGEDKLYACGSNNNGVLGLGKRSDTSKWTEVRVFKRKRCEGGKYAPQGFSVEKVVFGGNHSILKGKGVNGEDKLYASGWNNYGQLGLGDDKNTRRKWTEVPVPQGFSVEKVIAGREHSILKVKGKDGEDKVYACGANYRGQLGLGDEQSRDKWTEVPIADLLKTLQEDVNDRKKDGDVLEDSGSSSFSMGLNPRDCIF